MEFLLIIRGNDDGARFDLTEDDILIGREHGCDIRLKDAETSRRHAKLRKEGNHWILTDLDSSNGVYLNGTRVTEAKLALSDQIQIGRTLFRFSSTVTSENHSADKVNISDPVDGEESRIVHSYKKEDTPSDLFTGSASAPNTAAWDPKERDHLQLIYSTIVAISQTLDIDRLLNEIMGLIFGWLKIDRGCFLLCSQDSGPLVPKAVKRKTGTDEMIVINSSITDYVTATKEGVLTNQAKSQPFAQDMAVRGIREAICVPMLGRYGLVGLLYVDIVNTSETPTAEQAEEHEEEAASKSSSPPFYFHRGHLKLMFAIAHQVALAIEDTQYYSAMLQSERLAAVGQTVAVLSHHIKNILQGIQGGSYLIEKGLSAHDETMVGKGWHIVERNQGRISDLILDMLTFSKERKPVFEQCDINEVLDDVRELMENRAAGFEIELAGDFDRSIPPFYFDREQIHRAVTNLVTNAIDAVRGSLAGTQSDETAPSAAAHGLIRITSSRTDPKTVCITIDDNGPGIPEEIRADLFSPFFSKNKSGGTGLGLAVTHKIIQEHKGNLTVSESPENGARFVIELPFIGKSPEDD